MLNRRRFHAWASRALMAASAPSLLACGGSAAAPLATAAGRMPDEAEPHRRTWMAFGASEAIWGRELLPTVQNNLAGIANAIAAFEPVTMLVRPAEMALARAKCSAAVTLQSAALDDLWMRDTGPVFVKRPDGSRAALDFNFNGWGNKQAHANDARVAGVVAQASAVPRQGTALVLEGGGIEVDGQGTALITESCVLNPNRNPGWSKAQVEAELMPLLGLRRILWLPGVRGKDITDGHTDFYARFVEPGVVVAHLDTDPDSYDHAVTLAHLAVLRAARDADGQPLEVIVIEGPSEVRPAFDSDEFTAGYINFYVCNGAVIVPQFGDADADAAAAATLRSVYPGRQVVALNIDGIAAGGGGIHCTTQQEPA